MYRRNLIDIIFKKATKMKLLLQASPIHLQQPDNRYHREFIVIGKNVRDIHQEV